MATAAGVCRFGVPMIRIGEWRVEKYPAFLAQRANPKTGDTETRGLIQPKQWDTWTRHRQRKCLEAQVALLSSTRNVNELATAYKRVTND